jgi:23S rRNA (adenine2503-C2)-methyltransferase
VRDASGNPLDGIPAVGLPRDELIRLFAARGQPAFRADQVRQGLFRHGACRWAEVPGLPRALREELEGEIPLLSSRLLESRTAPGGTTRLALALADGQVVEAAVIPAGPRRTLCLSTQAGCPVGCAFCASGLGGLARDLEPWEMVEQAIQARRATGEAVNHLVVMGIGEPLYNLDNLLAALEVLQDEEGAGIGARRIVVSTIGVVPGIERLRERRPPLQLAVSLHAADPALRARLIPRPHDQGVDRIVAAARDYQEATGRQVTFEAVLLRGVNDGPEAADRMGRLLAGGGFFVNLIPCNPVPGLPQEPPPPARVRAFAAALARRGIAVRVRRPRGLAREAACGQLRAAVRKRGKGGVDLPPPA